MENDSRRPGVGRSDARSGSDAGSGSGSGTGSGGLSGAEARAALSSLDADATQLAERIVTPWWYHLVLGALVALAIGAQALPGAFSTIVIALVVVCLPLLIWAYSRRYGVLTTQPAGPRSKRMLTIVLIALVVLMGSNLLLKLFSLPSVWAVLPAIVGFGVTVLLGRRYDAVLRAEVAAPGEAR